MNKGFVIMAQNSDTVDYVACAEQLKKSIIRHVPESDVTIITEGEPGFQSDWQVYNLSPYEYTIKLESDMIITSNIYYWWETLQERDIVVSTTIRNFHGEISKERAYRQFIDDNNLPDVYNGITYFKKSPLAEEFFKTVKNIFENWEEYKKILKCDKNEEASTDWVYALACHIIGVEKTTYPFEQMSMVHMKQHINKLCTEDWTNELVYEFEPFRINSIPQRYPFHYHIKSFSDDLKGYYG